jgi:2Fe-2S ferredoxin
MIRVTFIEPTGDTRTLETVPSGSLMHLALANGVAGILAECGGTCGCGTCQVHLDEQTLGRIPPAADDEADMLSLSEYLTPASRLACQIKLTPELDGVIAKVPEIQG